MKQVPKLWVRQARAWGSWAVPPPSARGCSGCRSGLVPKHEAPGRGWLGSSRHQCHQPRLTAFLKGFCTLLVLGQGGPGPSCTLEGLAPGSLQEPLCWGQQLSSLS